MSTTKRTARSTAARKQPNDQPRIRLNRAPLVPEEILKRNKAYCRIDSRFRASARLLQCFWLQDQGIPTGSYSYRSGDNEIITEFGSILAPEAADAGKNFLDQSIHHLVLRELLLREDGAYYEEERLFANGLSSAPLTFNLLAKMKLDLDLASRVFRKLLPDFIATVEDIRFETSPWRREPKHGLNDGTAHDCAVHGIDHDGQPVTVFIEIKYSETMDGPAARHRPEYDEASKKVRLYSDPDDPLLRSVALEQFWREANLAQLCVDEGLTSRAVFMIIAPKFNRRVWTAIRAFGSLLIPAEDRDADRIDFHPITLEDVIATIADAGEVELSQQLWRRYCDFDRVYETCYRELTAPAQSDESSFIQLGEALSKAINGEAV